MTRARVFVTGSAGSMGSRLMGPHIAGVDASDLDLSKERPDLAGIEIVLHFAGLFGGDLATARANLDMTLNVIDACSKHGVKRLVIASSIDADPEMIGHPRTYYSGSKAAQEEFLKCWCAEDRGRIGVALRLGAFSPGISRPPDHEAYRLTETGLLYWVGKAVALTEPGFRAWLAVGSPASAT